MSSHIINKLIFNFGFLLEGLPGAYSDATIDYPAAKLDGILLEPLHGSFRASRTAQGLYLKGALYSDVDTHCARCNDPHRQSITMELDEHYYLPSAAPDENALLVFDDGVINLGQLVRELSVISVPIQSTCREDCQGLCMECGINLNHEECDCTDEDIDPRFAVLKELLNRDVSV